MKTGKEETSQQGNQGTRKQGKQGTREPENQGTREPGQSEQGLKVGWTKWKEAA